MRSACTEHSRQIPFLSTLAYKARIKVLNNRLSEYVRLAASGETVLVTDRDRVVAEIGPPRKTRSPILADALLAEAVRKGWLTPPVLVSEELPTAESVAPLRDLLARSER